MESDLSATMRDYLAEIYRLSHRGSQDSFVSTSALAELLDVSAPAVNRMVTKLKELGLLHHEAYRGIHLTEAGIQIALQKLRYHRIAEVFLVKVMGFGWHEVHEEAHRMSSAMSEIISQRMLEMAGFPAFCPHGEPIPDAEGRIAALNDLLLPEIELNRDIAITRVLTRESDRLEYLAALGLIPGTKLQIIHAAPFHGPLQLKLKTEYRIIGHNLAELIRAKYV